MKNPLISVLIPVYNTEEFLPDCLESVLKQTLENIEILCLNDGSTDESGAILKAFATKDARVRVIQKQNTGYGHTMNVGLDAARGKYIGIVESDDFASPEMFEQLCVLAERHETQVVKSNCYRFSSRGESVLSIYPDFVYGKVFVPKQPKYHCVFRAHASIWGGVYRRDFLREHNIRFNETPGASYQDTAFMFKVWACASRAYITKEPLLHYRTENPDSSSAAVSKVFCFCDEYAEIERFLEARPEKKERLIVTAITRKYCNYLLQFDMLASAYQYAFLLRMEEELRRDKACGYLQQDGFTEGQWGDLQLLLKDRELFFRQKAKDFTDARMRFFPTVNAEMYREGFKKYIEKFARIIVFGAGEMGKRVGQWILTRGGKEIFCFAVTAAKENPSDLFDVPVMEIGTLQEYTTDSLIVLAIKEHEQYEVCKRLERLGFQWILAIQPVLLAALAENERKNR